jgi:hypothetical protein
MMDAVSEATGKYHHSCRFASFLIGNFFALFSSYDKKSTYVQAMIYRFLKSAKTAPLFEYLGIYFLIFCKSLISFEKRRGLNLL